MFRGFQFFGVFLLAMFGFTWAAPGDISTYAGGGVGIGGTAINATLKSPIGLVMDSQYVYVAENTGYYVKKINRATGIITVVAGNGSSIYGGDGALASAATVTGVRGLALDTAGNLYIADMNANRVRKVTKSTGIISTVVGQGSAGSTGDNGNALSARISPYNIAVDRLGNIYIAEFSYHRIRKVDVSSGIITTIAGTGTGTYSGDDGQATSASIRNPWGVAVDSTLNVYIADFGNNRIRKVDQSTGIITTVVGNGAAGFAGDGGLATSAQIYAPRNVIVDRVGNLYVADGG